MNKEETPSSKMEYPKNQHLFNAIRDITGFTPLESDMRQILIAVEKDNPCSPPDEGALAEKFSQWCGENYLWIPEDKLWYAHEDDQLHDGKVISELLAIFKHQTGR